MKLAPLVVAAMVGSAAAINKADYLPECSLKCLDDATTQATDCSLDDGVCWCVQANYEAIYNAGVSCVLKECGIEKSQGEVLPAAARFCLDASASASAEGAEKTPAPSAQTTTAGNSTAVITSAPSGATTAAATSGAGEDVKSTSSSGGAAPTSGPVVGAALLFAGALAAL